MNTPDHDHEQEQEPMTTEELARLLFAPSKTTTHLEQTHERGNDEVTDEQARAFFGLPRTDEHHD